MNKSGISHSFLTRPMTANIGAEISGLELSQISVETAGLLRQALVDYKVLFIRDQQLDVVQLCEFSRQLGPLMKLPYIKPMENHPEVIAVLKEADEINMGVFGGDWHSDFSFLEQPPMASILYSVEVPDVGGDTLWVNMAAAYAALPEETRLFLNDKVVVHTGVPYGTANAPKLDEQFIGSIAIDRNNPEADEETLHPAVCKHPETGELMLFINPTYTTRFLEMTKWQSEPILKALYAHCTRPEFTCRFRWTPNTITMWDNRSTMHYAVNDYDGHRRLLYRTTIAGSKPDGP